MERRDMAADGGCQGAFWVTSGLQSLNRRSNPSLGISKDTATPHIAITVHVLLVDSPVRRVPIFFFPHTAG